MASAMSATPPPEVLLLLLLILNTLAADDSFYPNEGDRRLSLSALQAEGSILGRSGRLLLSLRDPSGCAAWATLPGGRRRCFTAGQASSGTHRLSPGADASVV